LPRGYVETVWKGENRILSPSFSEFYERVFLITRGDLFSWSRLSQVVEMNLGFYDHLLPSSLDMVAFDAAEELSEIEGEGGRESETIDVNDLLRLADRFLEAGDAGRASVAWGTARSMGAQGEQFLDTCARLGELLNQGDHGRLAMKVLTMCAQGAPEDLDIQTRLAQSLFSQGEFVEAAAAGKRGFDFSEPRVEPLEVVADVMNIRRVPEAEMNYRAILVLDPENEHAKEELLVIQSEMPNLQ